ncbi:ADP-ribose pyrophosphatase [Raphidocelis subcapitata]|uniref:ADP-ribose pyrophosphatase n=1 Tax=Raphidocelis subcapitata TaxID=307507 RepID=A0A2V0P4E3_9CHLO|nr:ADP-ribose pyrophosphatase [Raphidocelis subcapitata]|eukprot:GBF94734.1 ADP-ribose pyrophosphatase [Raphidocelis subcapitata]
MAFLPPELAQRASLGRDAIALSPTTPLYDSRPQRRSCGAAAAAADSAAAERQQPQQRPAAVTGRRTVAEGRFLRLVDLEYTRPPRSEIPRRWQAVERCTTAPRGDGAHGIDAVAVFAVVKSAARPPRLIFRPPLNSMSVELPAGLVDGGEAPEAAALRELREETGYEAARILAVGGRQYLSPGMTNENIATVFVEVDGDVPPAPQALEEDESIEVELLELGPGLAASLAGFEAEGFAVWVGLHSIAQGMGLAAMYGL